MSEKETIEDKELNERQKLFCELYTHEFNAKKAYIDAGYSENGAAVSACKLLTQASIKAEISRILKTKRASKEETEKLITDIAHSSVNDYLKVTRRWVQEKVKVPMAEFIRKQREEIALEEEIFFRYEGTTPEEQEAHEHSQARRRRELARNEVILEANPDAFKLVTQDIEREFTELDLDKLAKNKERGRIKSFSIKEDGVRVELFAADAALRDLLKIHGSYAPEKQEHTGKDGEPLTGQLTNDQFDKLLNKLNGK